MWNNAMKKIEFKNNEKDWNQAIKKIVSPHEIKVKT